MGVKQFFKIAVETFKPYKYKGLTQRSYLKTFLYFFSIALLYLLIMGMINVPRYYNTLQNVDEGLNNLEAFVINVDIQTKGPVVLSETPKIVVDTKSNGTINGEDLLITNDSISKKFFFWTKSLRIDKIDVLENFDSVRKNVFLLFLFIVPSIIFLAYMFIILKYLFVMLFASVIGAIILMLGKHKSTLHEVFKSSMYATGVYFAGNILGSLIKIKFIGLIAYTIFFLMILFMLKDEGNDFSGQFNEDSDDDT